VPFHVRPIWTYVCLPIPSTILKTMFAPSTFFTAEAGIPKKGSSSSGCRGRERNATLALISGNTRGSSLLNRTLVITVALARSAVGTIM
jgi:hypothetical protein